MSVDRSLLNLESRKNQGEKFLPALKIPGNEPDSTSDLAKLAEGLLTGKSAKELDELNSQLTGYVNLVPDPGLCVKMKDKDGKKIFLNLCTSDRVPPLAKDIAEEELVRALQNDDISFRVPMSIGEPHAETDRAGEPCVAYEVVIHPSLYAKLELSEIFYQFFLSLALEGMESKYSLAIDRNTTVVLKGKKYYGSIKEQRVRTKPKLITEIGGEEVVPEVAHIINSPLVLPEFKLWLDPADRSPRCLTAEIHLPCASNMDLLDLFVGDCRLVLTSSMIKPKNYSLDIFLPMEIVSDDIVASFCSTSHLLKVTGPLKVQNQVS